MGKKYYKLEIDKTDDVWDCTLLVLESIEIGLWNVKDSVSANSFQELLVKIGENNFIDIVNSNK